MKIVVLNGSPKGEYSLSLQYVRYMEKMVEDVEFECHHVGKAIKKLERQKDAFLQVVEQVAAADAVIWLFGVYIEMVPYQLKRFIELIYENKAEGAFRDKYSVSLSTSIRWLDHCAHNYMQAVSDDLEMNFAGFFSAHTNDLFEPLERERLLNFADSFYDSIAGRAPYLKRYKSLESSDFIYRPGNVKEKVSTGGKDILVLSDYSIDSDNLRGMVERFKSSYYEEVEEIDIASLDIKGGCISCFRCTYDNSCIYEGRDSFNKILERVVKADILIFAGAVRDRFFSARWKLFMDRSFVKGHVPIFKGKQMALIVAGPMRELSTLRDPFEQAMDWQRANLVDFISDDCKNSELINNLIANLAIIMIKYSDNNYIKSPTFNHVALSKLARDELRVNMGVIMKADNRYYRKNGLMKIEKMGLFNRFIGALYHLKGFRENMFKGGRLSKIQLIPLQKIVKEAKR